ncbi:predicted protein [Sclerotinia sclerotiorum 1980 UF-70]|uniref:Uncharacterized protein n=1 Tax=Sclerotinia sclerotiorum (strain ATCC 18683 / 1980 / Ss-1) TaxID=665079 RepID=A7E9N9_SCLS1|nr:predicted protein [Sclerotinia sclerotiorum 1980 UF-70]EDN97091.1 predicted protein [Sclerotinia sclerotiorum 1980 UF-70]
MKEKKKRIQALRLQTCGGYINERKLEHRTMVHRKFLELSNLKTGRYGMVPAEGIEGRGTFMIFSAHIITVKADANCFKKDR